MTPCFHAVNVTICRPSKMAEKPIRKRNRWKWCFNCRERLPHMLTMQYEIKPSYYDPIIFWKCGKCGKDRTSFNGY